MSAVWQTLKGSVPLDDVAALAAKLAVREVKEFYSKYPKLEGVRGLGKPLVAQLSDRVLIQSRELGALSQSRLLLGETQ